MIVVYFPIQYNDIFEYQSLVLIKVENYFYQFLFCDRK